MYYVMNYCAVQEKNNDFLGQRIIIIIYINVKQCFRVLNITKYPQLREQREGRNVLHFRYSFNIINIIIPCETSEYLTLTVAKMLSLFTGGNKCPHSQKNPLLGGSKMRCLTVHDIMPCVHQSITIYKRQIFIE